MPFAHAPKLLKWFLFTIAAFSFLSTQVKSLFGVIPFFPFFGLSLTGLKLGFIWQLLTFGFLYEPGTELSFGFLLSLFFNLYLLYIVGLSLIQTKGMRDFVFLFFGGLCFTGLLVALTLFLTNSPVIYSSSSTLTFLALTAWMMLDPERQLLLFMTIPIKIKWLVLLFFGSQIFVEFMSGNFIQFVGLFTPCVFSWLFSLLRWKTLSPFNFLHPFENLLLRTKKSPEGPKVYDFKTGLAITIENDAPKKKGRYSFFKKNPY